mgnify:CR=1 FL=1
MSFWIVTDACGDLPASYLQKQERLLVAPMSYQMDGGIQEIHPLSPTAEADSHTFYQRLMAGSNATTFQINEQSWLELLSPLLERGEDVLALVFSSGLSGTYEACRLAVEKLRARYPERKIFAVDSLCASLGQGLFVHHVLTRRDAGMGFDEAARWALDNRKKIIHWFTVDDLMFLKRGGRVSATSAAFGTMLKIKPVLHVDDEGHLIPMEKVQGRKRSIKALLEKAREVDLSGQAVFISHADCPEDAQWLADKLRAELGVQEILINTISPIIGSHTGQGTVALFYMAEKR